MTVFGLKINLPELFGTVGLSPQDKEKGKSKVGVMVDDPGIRQPSSGSGSAANVVAETLRGGLYTRVVGRRLLFFQEVGSTMDEAVLRAERGTDEGTVVVAETLVQARTAGNQPGEVCHVGEKGGADRIGNRAEAGEVDRAGIGRAAADDEPGPVLVCQALDLAHVDEARGIGAVADRVEPFARQVGRRAVAQMAAGVERHAQHRVARL